MDGTSTAVTGVKTSTASTGTSEVFTREQVVERERKARSDGMADLGRVKKSNETLQAEVARLRKEQEEQEEAMAKDEPEKLVSIRAHSQLRQRDAELAKAQEELNEVKAKLADYTAKDQETAKEKVAREVAGRLNVDAATVARLAKFTDGSAEAMEEIAKSLPRLGSSPSGKPDSSTSHGGGSKSATDVRLEYAQGKITAIQYAEQMKALGKEP